MKLKVFMRHFNTFMIVPGKLMLNNFKYSDLKTTNNGTMFISDLDKNVI